MNISTKFPTRNFYLETIRQFNINGLFLSGRCRYVSILHCFYRDEPNAARQVSAGVCLPLSSFFYRWIQLRLNNHINSHIHNNNDNNNKQQHQQSQINDSVNDCVNDGDSCGDSCGESCGDSCSDSCGDCCGESCGDSCGDSYGTALATITAKHMETATAIAAGTPKTPMILKLYQ